MRLAGQILVFLVLLGFLAVRWVNSDAWASSFFKVLWWIVLLLVIVECLTFVAPRLMVP
jgi:hypothetical protein